MKTPSMVYLRSPVARIQVEPRSPLVELDRSAADLFVKLKNTWKCESLS